ncbi:hypothetical protein COW36_07845 [bacterium (Candidatus Blackallbacteria) CG17_big_fil_post_rev_8_21_14_2_50_48_46]|uniref:Uncharacterized protein n=1 Tax=bacterium (Candidatus Blackallbacteria) CG17_big_fil_post_rev_8_21_14_2_50_48_46 TaxID=2014261 RepID=A0A2M7G6V5_9BACT|nr:MAG: hypothetical protein COW64_23175 [bacterium (Candidatus Blackallbacteria) CG18_big_fil_WC_8_21_14_2_50_49_26]PIW17646.1 MAG: hypothetical protein COW36_07845 [bacterium (Candidatus Blackallbacteria) CG17_big_fil_post_rev_8_21_14_2_50_48_46]PIW49302.1 MAG: hypothetical protein COW20_06335 [bacterium (Candidatus Blackallbacteria) CG13_big_fil_rev_8_21_14_2_50_49_14]
MFALRQIVEDPGDFIPVPPEVKHKRTEVIFLLVDQPSISEEKLSLASLAGSWSGSLEREPQGEYEQRLELE